MKILQVNCEAQLCLGRTAAAVSGTVCNQLNIHHYVMDAFCHSEKQRGFSQISYINFVGCKERIFSKIPETQESVLGSRDECNAMHL